MEVSKQKFLKESYEKSEKYITLYDEYRYNYQLEAITPKFYSSHDNKVLSNIKEDLLQKIKIHKDSGPKLRMEWPETTNMEYGWFSTPLVHVDRNDEKYYFPHNTPEFMKHELILQEDITMKTPKFTGVPFKFG